MERRTRYYYCGNLDCNSSDAFRYQDLGYLTTEEERQSEFYDEVADMILEIKTRVEDRCQAIPCFGKRR